ncbi:MAG: hypothetical protein J7K40_06900 [candidate division Zixibacteria bacterium]|nr:hypothetical protein [candidate division Zixibacteria bacterium]
MKKALILLFLLILPITALAQFNDHDGHLAVTWQAPDYGNPLDHYIWSYTINGVVDSLTGVSPAEDIQENSVILTNVGDWALFTIRAISTVDDTSEAIVSDTVYYNTGLGIGPPRGVNWIQGP